MKTSHTPGPWTAERFGSIKGGLYRQYTNGKAQDQLASVMPIVEDNGCYEANARLIAAAPDLLAALVALKADYEELARNHADAWHEDEVFLHQKLNDAARAAIAKATISQ